MQSHYETLEVSPRASSLVIQAAYRSLVQRNHPDKNPLSKNAGAVLSNLNRAYAVLSDPAQRQDYDLLLGGGTSFNERRGRGDASRTFRDPQASSRPTSRPFGFRPLG